MTVQSVSHWRNVLLRTSGETILDDITGTVGQTPLVRLGRLMRAENLAAEILAKLEFFNPVGSVKDRSALAMIEALEASGELAPDTELVEATSGNNGVACAWACALKGIPLTVVMPEHMSVERRGMIALFGAKLELTPKALGTKGSIDRAGQLVRENPRARMLGQFSNPANPARHRETTAEEIWQGCGGRLDAVVVGIGTGGTFMGLAEALRPCCPGLQMIAVEPAGCPVLSEGRAGVHAIQGLSSGHVPEILRPELIDEVLTVEDDEAIAMARRLARLEGMAVGISSGAAAVACVRLARRPGFAGKRIVTVFADTAMRYFSTPLFD